MPEAGDAARDHNMKDVVLIADDETDVVDLVCSNLLAAGFQTLEAGDGPSALAMIRERRPSIAVLDVMMPGMTGLEILRTVKNSVDTARIPVVLLTARVSHTDRIVAFELGADDYVTKPFSPRELVLRIRGILRRIAGTAEETWLLETGGIRLDIARHEATARGRSVELTAIEFKLLAALMERPGRVQSRTALANAVWGIDHPIENRTVDTHVRRLREKLGSAADQIQTVRGFGYRIDAMR